MGVLEEADGRSYITQLSGMVSSSAHIVYHSRIIAQKSLARQLITYTSNIQTKAFDPTQDVDELMQEAEGSLFSLSQKNLKKDYQINSTEKWRAEKTSKFILLHWYQNKTKIVQDKYKTISFPTYECKIPNKILEIISKLEITERTYTYLEDKRHISKKHCKNNILFQIKILSNVRRTIPNKNLSILQSI